MLHEFCEVRLGQFDDAGVEAVMFYPGFGHVCGLLEGAREFAVREERAVSCVA